MTMQDLFSSNNPDKEFSASSIEWAPLLAVEIMWALALIFAILTGLAVISCYRRRRYGLALLRILIGAAFLIILGNPSLVKEQRKPVRDTAIILVDQSPSQSLGDRQAVSEKALAAIQDQITRDFEDLELRIIKSGELTKQNLAGRTELFSMLDDIQSDIPPRRRAGVIILSDGQIHDVPDHGQRSTSRNTQSGPIHILLSGSRQDKDRRLVIESAPAYGIVGQDITVRYRIEDTENIRMPADIPVRLILRNTKGQIEEIFHPAAGLVGEVTLPIDHAGQNLYEIEAEAIDGELSLQNNKAAILVNGVRDRLKVLLISGKPHPGERTWRNILTADPAVDLVHFTILREPHKLNNVAQEDLSLIPFPFRELFEVKLYEFDLIIFDRYRANRIMPRYYFRNIAKYVRQGGALLEASGPEFADGQSIFDTDLGAILPAVPTGRMLEKEFRPVLSDIGRHHPVTRDLGSDSPGQGSQNQGSSGQGSQNHWGRWLRQVEVAARSGHVLLNGADNAPLLILDRVEDGRIAQLSSDLIWLWDRGYDGGGPQADLLRRLAHWLMKEPELEENALEIIAEQEEGGAKIHIRRRMLDQAFVSSSLSQNLLMTRPDGTGQEIILETQDEGWTGAQIKVNRPGLYKFSDGRLNRAVLIGAANSPEMDEIITSENKARGPVRQSGGTVLWLEDHHPAPIIRHIPANSSFSGYGWIGLRQNQDFTVSGLLIQNLIHDGLALLFLAALLLFGWWREGQHSK